jgi:hypothetical protein
MESNPNMATRVAQQPVIMFDTHAYVRHMCQGGFSEKQAEASADALTDAFRGAVVTQDVLKSELLVCRDEFRSDMQESQNEVRGEFKAVRGEMQKFQNEVQGEFKAVRGEIQEVRGEIQEVREEVRVGIQEVRGEVRVGIQEVRGEIIKSENKLVYAMGAGFVGIAALMVVLFNLFKV